MGGLEIFFLSFVLGFICNYVLTLKYVKYLRGEFKNKISDVAIIITSIIWGTPIILFMYFLFVEIRLEDKANHNRLLISEIVIFILQIVAVVLMAYFGLLTLPNYGNNNETTTQILYIFNNLN